MPNHVRNVLTFKNLSSYEKEFIAERFTNYNDDEYTLFATLDPTRKIFDFNTIVPEPRVEADCPDDCKVNKDSHIEGDKDRPWFDWYKWHNKYWSTKWNAYDGYTFIGADKIECNFHTAWSTPFAVYEQLACNYPNFEWEVKFADECGGENCGYLVHEKGKSYIYDKTSDMTKDELYRELWEGDE